MAAPEALHRSVNCICITDLLSGHWTLQDDTIGYHKYSRSARVTCKFVQCYEFDSSPLAFMINI